MKKNIAAKAASSTYQWVLCSLLAALTAVFSQIAIPLPFTPIPINLGTLAVFLTGGLLAPKYAAAAQLLYIMLGAVGLPVFARFSGGFGTIAGPTGGYIIGYIAGAVFISLLRQRLSFCKKSIPGLTLSLMAGLAACYALGTVWYMFLTKNPLLLSLSYCVFPFLFGDALKIAAAALLIRRLTPFIH